MKNRMNTCGSSRGIAKGRQQGRACTRVGAGIRQETKKQDRHCRQKGVVGGTVSSHSQVAITRGLLIEAYFPVRIQGGVAIGVTIRITRRITLQVLGTIWEQLGIGLHTPQVPSRGVRP